MAYTFGDLRKETYKLIDEYSSRGTVLAASKTLDVLHKVKSLANTVQMDLASTKAKILTKKGYVLNPIENDSSYNTSAIKLHRKGSDEYISRVGALAYFFEANGPATITIDEYIVDTWVNLSTITILSSVTSLTEYKGVITPSDVTNNVRLNFGGNYAYSYCNYKLYTDAFESAGLVQQHRKYFQFSLPSDYLVFHMMFKRVGNNEVPFSDMKLDEASRIIAINRSYAPAEFPMYYGKYPTDLVFTSDETANDALTFGISDVAAKIMPYKVAGEVLSSSGMMGRGNDLINKYLIAKEELPEPVISTSEAIVSATKW